MSSLETIERTAFNKPDISISERLTFINRSYMSYLTPENGIYGVTEVLKDNGLVERIGKNEFGHTYKEYLSDGKLYLRREILGSGRNATTSFDDNGTAYLRTVTKLGENKASVVSRTISPNTTIVKDNFAATIDAFGRPVLNKVTDLSLNTNDYSPVTKLRDTYYKLNDEVGHLIPNQFGGPASPENVVAQLREVNRGVGSKIRQVEMKVAELKQNGHTVDYEMKTNYVGSDKRPSSFEPKITVDGNECDLPDDLKKIYNDADDSAVKNAITTAGEKFGLAHETGVKSGLLAAGITLTVSAVDNVSAYVDGEISAEEMAVEIIKDTGTAAALGYGTAFVSTTVAQAMSGSSSALIRSVGGSCLPAAVVSFAVDSYDSISDYAQGKIDGAEFAYELGESAASVAGSFAGGALAGAAAGAVAGPVGAVTGSIVGGVVGCVVATELYATAVDLGVEGAEHIAEQAEKLAQGTVQIVEEYIPDKLDDVKNAFADFVKDAKLPFKL